MTLFLVDVVQKEKRQRVLVYAENGIAARAHLRGRFPGCDLQSIRELPNVTKHFLLAEEEAL